MVLARPGVSGPCATCGRPLGPVRAERSVLGCRFASGQCAAKGDSACCLRLSCSSFGNMRSTGYAQVQCTHRTSLLRVSVVCLCVPCVSLVFVHVALGKFADWSASGKKAAECDTRCDSMQEFVAASRHEKSFQLRLDLPSDGGSGSWRHLRYCSVSVWSVGCGLFVVQR